MNRHRLAQAAGRRFELSVLKKLKAEFPELQWRRVDETTGRTHGADIDVFRRGKRIPITFQCKATKTRTAGLRGLWEAHRTHQNDFAWFCIHSWRWARQKSILKVFTKGVVSVVEVLTWEQFIDRFAFFVNSLDKSDNL